MDGAADDEAEGGAAENGAEGGAAGASAGPASARTVWDAEVWLNRGKSPESHQHIHLVLTPTDTGLSVVTACQAGNQLRARERAVPKLALDGKDTQASLQFLCEQRIDGELNWHAVDLDSDGTFDRIEGSGTGIQYLPYADGFDSIALQGPLELVALPDTSAPKLLAPNLDANPVDVVALYPSEPIEASSRLTLTWNGARRVLRGAGDSMSTAFSSELILPFGSTWDVRATGRDLAGHAFEDPSTTLMMMIDPGVFPQDGFEGAGADRVSLSGPAQIVSRLGTLPALSGAHSLLLRVGSEATLHLVRGDCARHLRFDARVLLSMDGGSVPAYRVDAGVIGGSARPHDSLTGGDGIKPTGDPTWRYEGTHAEYGLDLDEPGRDIVVRFKIAPQETCWPRSYCQGQVAILIDDVRME